MCSISTLWEQRVPSLSDGWHACSRRCQLALDLTIRGTGYITTPLHSLGDCNEVGVFFNSLFSQLLLSRKYYNFESDIATLSFVFADRRATARTTTFVEPCCIRKKKATNYIICFKHPSWIPMITSGSGIGAFFGFHQSPLPLVASSHSGIGASFGFHQSPPLAVASCLMALLLSLGFYGAFFLCIILTPL